MNKAVKLRREAKRPAFRPAAAITAKAAAKKQALTNAPRTVTMWA
jgi:hypothetical protein